MRTIIKNWRKENAFRRLKLMGISIDKSVYLSDQYRSYQEEDEGVLPPPLAHLFEDEIKNESQDLDKDIEKNYREIMARKPEWPACPMMVIMRKRVTYKDYEEEDENGGQ